MNRLLGIWEFFTINIVMQPAYFTGFIVMVGYILLGKKWYDVLSGVIKAIVGYFILTVGSNGLISNFQPIIKGMKDIFHVHTIIIDPYIGQNAVTSGIGVVYGKSFTHIIALLLLAFIINILLVKFRKITKLRVLFTTGHVQFQQASTAFWLLMFACPFLENQFIILLLMAVILGLYWAVGCNLTVEPTQELTRGAGFCMAHQQQFGIYVFSRIAEWMAKRDLKKGKQIRNLDAIALPSYLSIFKENIVSNSILMTIFFGTILLCLGKNYLVSSGFIGEENNFGFYIITTSLYFSVYLSILQLGVRTFITELTTSFQGISHKLIQGAMPGVDCSILYGFGSSNAVSIGFMAGALGQFIAILILLALKSPTIIIAGFVPIFFDNATIAIYANNKGGMKAAIILPCLAGIIQVFGSALIASVVGLSNYGGYLGMFDWATVWPLVTFIIRYFDRIGLCIIIYIFIRIPQWQYRKDPEGYFLVSDDYEQYVKYKTLKERV